MEFIKNTNFDFIGKRKICYIFSTIVIIAGIIKFSMNPKNYFGVDFIGGDLLQIEMKILVDVSGLRTVLKDFDVVVQSVGKEERKFIIRGNCRKIKRKF